MAVEQGETQKDFALTYLRQLGGLAQLKEFTVLGVPTVVLRRLVAEHRIINPARGVYALSDLEMNPVLAFAVEAISAPATSVICLQSAAYLQGLIGRDPRQLEFFVPRGTWRPKSAGALPIVPISYKQFDSLGRLVRVNGLDPSADMLLAGRTFTSTSPAKTVADLFSYRNVYGHEVAVEALGTFLEKDGTIGEVEAFAEQNGIADIVHPYLSGAGTKMNRRF
jgi:hypothetical protein